MSDKLKEYIKEKTSGASCARAWRASRGVLRRSAVRFILCQIVARELADERRDVQGPPN
jgi:hypothetical protein